LGSENSLDKLAGLLPELRSRRTDGIATPSVYPPEHCRIRRLCWKSEGGRISHREGVQTRCALRLGYHVDERHGRAIEARILRCAVCVNRRRRLQPAPASVALPFQTSRIGQIILREALIAFDVLFPLVVRIALLRRTTF